MFRRKNGQQGGKVKKDKNIPVSKTVYNIKTLVSYSYLVDIKKFISR